MSQWLWVTESGSRWGLEETARLCEDCPVLFHCNGQCGKNPLPEPTLKNIHQHTLFWCVFQQFFQTTQCTQTLSHTHMLVPKLVNLEIDLYIFTALWVFWLSALSHTHPLSCRLTHQAITWLASHTSSICLNGYSLLVSIKNDIVLTSLQIYISLNISHLKCVWCHRR